MLLCLNPDIVVTNYSNFIVFIATPVFKQSLALFPCPLSLSLSLLPPHFHPLLFKKRLTLWRVDPVPGLNNICLCAPLSLSLTASFSFGCWRLGCWVRPLVERVKRGTCERRVSMRHTSLSETRLAGGPLADTKNGE